MLFTPYLCFAAVHEKKEEKATKAAEQGKKKTKHVGIISLWKAAAQKQKPQIQTAGWQQPLNLLLWKA